MKDRTCDGCRLSENNAIQKLNEDFFQNTASTNRHDLTGGGGPFMCWYDSVGVYCTLYSPWTRRSRLPLQVVEYNQKGHTAVQCRQSTVFECRLHSTTRPCIVFGQATVVVCPQSQNSGDDVLANLGPKNKRDSTREQTGCDLRV